MSVYDKLVGATTEGSLPPAVLAHLDERYFTQGDQSVTVTAYGAVGDGTADDTTAIQAALDSGAAFVYVPTGRYRISAPLRVPSNTVFYTFSATLVSDAPGLEAFIHIWSSYPASRRRDLAGPANATDRTLVTKTAHPYAPGDILRLVSQRISTNPVDAGADQLGYATTTAGSGQGPFFSEFVRVQNVTETTITLDTGLLFNGYRPDGAEETDEYAGDSAYLTGTDGNANNVSVHGFTLEGEAIYGVRVVRAQNVHLRDISWSRELPGRFIQFLDCYYSDAERCYIETRQWTEPDQEGGVSHAAINQYHVVASWHTGFTQCRSVRGTQPYDFTYASVAPFPSVFCYVRNSTAEGNLFNPVTAHPGTYGTIIEGNAFTECQRSGISVRANSSQVTQNIVRGSGVGVGMYIAEGGGKQSLIDGNIVERFAEGLSVRDGAGKPFVGWIGVTFSDNHVIDCGIGYQRRPMAGLPLPAEPEGITLLGNTFASSLPDAVGVETSLAGRPIWGLTVQGNSFRMTGGSGVASIRVTNNSRGVAVIGNTFWETGVALSRDSSGQVHAWPAPCVTEYTGNITHAVASINVPTNTAEWRLMSRDVEPHPVMAANLNLYTETVVIRNRVNADTSPVNNWPTSDIACIAEIKRWDHTFTVQQVTTTTGDMHQRRASGSSWGAWSKRH